MVLFWRVVIFASFYLAVCQILTIFQYRPYSYYHTNLINYKRKECPWKPHRISSPILQANTFSAEISNNRGLLRTPAKAIRGLYGSQEATRLITDRQSLQLSPLREVPPRTATGIALMECTILRQSCQLRITVWTNTTPTTLTTKLARAPRCLFVHFDNTKCSTFHGNQW